MNFGRVAHSHHTVVVEIRLLNLAIAESDLFCQGQPHPIDHTPLDLGDNVVRLHSDTGIDGYPEIVNPDLS